jgi:preprotein translocase subunit Sec61beta
MWQVKSQIRPRFVAIVALFVAIAVIVGMFLPH